MFEIDLSEINWAIIAPLFVIQLILAIIALTDLVRREAGTTRGPKLMWVPIVLFIQFVGPVIYFIFGRRDNE